MTVGKMVLPQDSSFGTLAFLQLFIQMAEYNVFIDNAEVFADAVPDGIAEAVDGQQFFGIRSFLVYEILTGGFFCHVFYL